MNSNVTSAEARNHFPDLVNLASYAKKRTVITRRGKEVAAIIPIEDLERLIEIENLMDIKEAEESLATGEFEDWKDAKKEIVRHLGLKKDGLQNRNRKKGKKNS